MPDVVAPLPPFVTARCSVQQLAADTELTIREKIRKAKRLGLIKQVGPDEFVINVLALEKMQRVGASR
jgi:hypothetical protein